MNTPEDFADLNAQVATLRAQRDSLAHSCKSVGWLNERNILAMQAAWIESQTGSPIDGMNWIENTLAGPGLLPDWSGSCSAQEWFDAGIAKLGGLPRIGVTS